MTNEEIAAAWLLAGLALVLGAPLFAAMVERRVDRKSVQGGAVPPAKSEVTERWLLDQIVANAGVVVSQTKVSVSANFTTGTVDIHEEVTGNPLMRSSTLSPDPNGAARIGLELLRAAKALGWTETKTETTNEETPR